MTASDSHSKPSAFANKPVFVSQLRHLVRPRSFSRFMVVGGVNTMVGVVSFPILFGVFGRQVGINLLLTVSSILCTSFSYTTHRMLTFQSRGAYHVEVGKFCLLSLLIYLINLAVINMVPMLTGVHPVVVQIVTTVVLSGALMLLNYFGMNHFVFASIDVEEEKGINPAETTQHM